MLVIEGVQERRQLLKVIRHPVRLKSQRACLKHLGIRSQLLDQAQLVRIRQHREIHVTRGWTDNASFRGDTPEAANSCMRVLHIVHRVVAGTLLGQLQIKLQVGLGIPHEKIKLRRISPNLINHFPHGDELTGPLGHLHFDAVPEQLHQLNQHDLETIFWMSVGLHDGLHAWNIPVVVGTEHIDQEIIATPQLVMMVGDIGGQVRILTILFLDNTVLFIAVQGRPKPPCTLLVEQELPGFQFIQSLFNGFGFQKGRFAEPGLDLDAERPKVLTDKSQQYFIRQRPTASFKIGRIQLFSNTVELGLDLLGHRCNVRTMIAVFGKCDGPSGQFLVPSIDGRAQQFHLSSGVVDIILAHGIVPDRIQ